MLQSIRPRLPLRARTSKAPSVRVIGQPAPEDKPNPKAPTSSQNGLFAFFNTCDESSPPCRKGVVSEPQVLDEITLRCCLKGTLSTRIGAAD